MGRLQNVVMVINYICAVCMHMLFIDQVVFSFKVVKYDTLFHSKWKNKNQN